MKKQLFLLLFVSVTAIAQTPITTLNPLTEVRYCGFVPRTATGEIKRRADVLTAFQKIHACPSTGLYSGSCPGWSKDHVWPLACGGCDSVSNLAWVPNLTKSCSDIWCKDRYERKINTAVPPAPDSGNCTNAIVTMPIVVK